MYSSERNIQQLVYLLKAHNIKRVIVSPGNTNISFVGSIQDDPYFEMFSCVDERSAVYMACGMAEYCEEPIVVSCTGATAARNYSSGLTEAYYRKLPIIAITSSQYFGRVGNLYPQFTDRSILQNDVVTLSVQISTVNCDEDLWSNNVRINNALLQVRRKCGGPVHINIETSFSADFSVSHLPRERVIHRYSRNEPLPNLEGKRICVFVGSHNRFSKELENEIDEFCEKYNAVVLCDHTSNYKGKYRVLGGIVQCQEQYYSPARKTDVVIHIGEISGSYYSFKNTEIWRVSEDGEVRDAYKLLTAIFEMDEMSFFKEYNHTNGEYSFNSNYYTEWKNECERLYALLPELPFSNVWIAKQTANKLPQNSVLHLGILNSLRSWNLFEIPQTVYAFSNVGGFGIDGALSSCIGSSLSDPSKTNIIVLGDLATFYDLSILGNRHVRNNVRILVVNNGTGFEMHCSGSIGNCFGSDADKYMAGGGHFGNKSKSLLKHIANDLDFEYFAVETKSEYLSIIEYFLDEQEHQKSIIVEAFVNVCDEEKAYNESRNLIKDAKGNAKKVISAIVGRNGYEKLKCMAKKIRQ